MSSQQVLYLFSSNIRPLYEQDILDVLAAPSGGVYQFRYEKRWVGPDRGATWLTIPEGTPVLVNFSMQQQARYYDPVFFPIRRGTVKRTFAEGDALFVEFLLGDLVCLPEAERDEQGRLQLAAETAKFTSHLALKSVPHPYEASAGLGSDIFDVDGPLDFEADQITIFDRLTRYLQPTDSFRDARFLRFLRLAARGENDSVNPDHDGVFHLVAGTTYTLELFHHQPVEVTREDSFLVSVDNAIIRVIGRAGFEIGSRYDRIAIPLHAVQSDRYEARETVLVIEPGHGVRGPQLRLRLRVDPPAKRLVAGTVGSTLALGILGSVALWPVATAARVGAIVFALALIAGLNLLGLYSSALASAKWPSLPGSGSAGTPAGHAR